MASFAMKDGHLSESENIFFPKKSISERHNVHFCDFDVEYCIICATKVGVFFVFFKEKHKCSSCPFGVLVAPH